MRFKVLFCIIVLLLVPGCGKENESIKREEIVTTESFIKLFKEKCENVILPSNIGKATLTRQQMCGIVSYAINNTEFLKNKYIPKDMTIERGRESRYFKRLFQGRDSTDESIVKQMKNAKKCFLCKNI